MNAWTLDKTIAVAHVALLALALGACKSEDLLAGLADAATPDAAQCGAIVFLNRVPTDFTPGASDSVANTSPIVSVPVQTTGAGVDDNSWQMVVTCVADLLQPFEVTVTDVDPGTVDHLEVAFSGFATDLDLEPTIGSIASGACPPENRREVSFVFRAITGGTRELCEQAVWTVGINTGLDAALGCEDVMTIGPGCDDKTVLDQQVQCGEFEARPCRCTGLPTQSSYQTMSEWFGQGCGGAP